jgi:hypothetical protein
MKEILILKSYELYRIEGKRNGGGTTKNGFTKEYFDADKSGS